VLADECDTAEQQLLILVPSWLRRDGLDRRPQPRRGGAETAGDGAAARASERGAAEGRPEQRAGANWGGRGGPVRGLERVLGRPAGRAARPRADLVSVWPNQG